ncbi:GD25083 [Drosophila simulans]|uniref:GD25083 n=1 Tax=Drosophila simulans TaxID=7240 RepID=B4QI60_DROSI|nr:GD25083 [Drosophila simulans]
MCSSALKRIPKNSRGSGHRSIFPDTPDPGSGYTDTYGSSLAAGRLTRQTRWE